jgi:polyphosphate kinase
MVVKKESHFFNRELSWLAFNQRVLEEAKGPDNPLLERLKFLAITASNLDEFYMVRVGGLHMARKAGRRKRDASGRTPLELLREVQLRARAMMEELHGCYCNVVSPGLKKAGMRHALLDELTSEQESVLYTLFHEELFPVITPFAVALDRPFPLLHNLSLYMLVRLREKGRSGHKGDRYAVMPLDRFGARIIPLPDGDGFSYILREEVVKKYAADWFPGFELKESSIFRITRNADFSVREEEAPDLMIGMEDVLDERITGDVIRLEVEEAISDDLLHFLCSHFALSPDDAIRLPGILNLKDLMALSFRNGFDELKVEDWPPQPSPQMIPNEPIVGQIAQNDFLLYHPYESFNPVIRFVEEAADDPNTLAIKMVLYRTTSHSPIVLALLRAAKNGVNVTVLIELKARFDEARNIGWARELEQNGVQVVYGVKGYKTHAKICLVIRQEARGVVRYCHFGTGNYNENTAKLYGDISYMTCRPEYGADASAFFNALCGYAQPRDLMLLSMAPLYMRDRLIELIDVEIERASKGKKALIMAKVNSLVDVALIEKLYEASRAGVKIELNVRGICTLRPGVKGLSENIRVMSIVDRYLEHARILYFHHGGKPVVYISSADWMTRNLDKRLELMVPVDEPSCKRRLIDILKLHLADNCSSWTLEADGRYNRTKCDGKKEVRSQQIFFQQACEQIADARNMKRTRFEPHRTVQ